MQAKTPGGRTVYYKMAGSGPPLLLVHGGNFDADFMTPLADRLRERFTCISLDRPGYRRSGSLDRDSTVEDQTAAIRAVHAAVGDEPAWVLGHSSGGNFSLAYALQFPNAVRGLVLMEPALYGLYPQGAQPWGVRHMREVALPLFRAGDIERGFAEFGRVIELNPDSVNELLALPFGHQLEENKASFARDQAIVIEWCPGKDALAALRCPVLLLEADQTTRLLRDIVQLLQPLIPRATVTTLASCDHLAPQLRPKETARAVLDFVEAGA